MAPMIMARMKLTVISSTGEARRPQTDCPSLGNTRALRIARPRLALWWDARTHVDPNIIGALSIAPGDDDAHLLQVGVVCEALDLRLPAIALEYRLLDIPILNPILELGGPHDLGELLLSQHYAHRPLLVLAERVRPRRERADESREAHRQVAADTMLQEV